MSINKVEIQDSAGNVYHPHTDADVVKYGNSTVGLALSDMESQLDFKKSIRLDCDSFGLIGANGKLFIDRISRSKKLTLTNSSVAALTAVDAWIKIKNEVTVPSLFKVHLLNVGLNDVRKWGSEVNFEYRLSHYIQQIVAYFRLKELHITTDASITYTGTWQSYALPDSFSSNKYTSVTGASLQFTFSGDNLTIGTYNATNSGTMRVTIDGVNKLEINLISGNPTLYSIMPLIFEGLGSGTHTCKIEKIDTDTSKVIHFEYWGTKGENPPTIIVNGITKMKTDSYGLLSPDWNKASDSLIEKANKAVREALAVFDEKVMFIDQADYNPNNYNLIRTDLIHPNNFGHEWIATNILNQWY